MKYIPYAMLFFCSVLFAQKQATYSYIESEAVSSEKYQSMTFNGVWSWFSDPRAVYYEGKYKRTYAGWIDNYGDVHIGYYDHDTKQIASTVIHDNLEIDDHDNPTILFDDDGRLIVFYNTHLQTTSPLYMRTSTQPEDINTWSSVNELFLNDTTKFRGTSVMQHTYTNPVRLSKEAGNIYLFWRGVNLKPSYAVSSDNGKTWSNGTILFIPDQTNTIKAPYTKVYSDGISKIHFTFTDGHPTKERKNGLYYMYYENGAFYKANGTKIKEVSQLPILQSELDVIFESDTVKSWNWDIAQDSKGNPIVTYAKFPDEKTHIYAYATFQNGTWKSYDIVNAGGWFPKTRDHSKEPEPHYSGGIVLDHETPNTVYLSIKKGGVFEIEQWTTHDKGESWKAKEITMNSTKDNVRPFAVRGAKEGNPLQVLWLQNTTYIYYAHDTRGNSEELNFRDRYRTAVKMNLLNHNLTDELKKDNLIELLRRVAAQLLENPYRKLTYTYWRYGLSFAGIEAFYDLTKEARYHNELINIKQYEQEEDEFGEERKVPNLIWHYAALEKRAYLQKLEEVVVDDFMNIEIGLSLASMMRAIEKFDEYITDIDKLKSKIIENSDLFIKEFKTDDPNLSIATKALLIYGISTGIRNGIFDKKYKKDVMSAWRKLQAKLLEKNSISSLDNWTCGAILIAGKEVLGMLDAKQH